MLLFLEMVVYRFLCFVEVASLENVFMKLINMSISAGWLILAVLILRIFLKKSPKWINVLLWGIVAVRLISPFNFESTLSLIPSAETVPMDIGMKVKPNVDSGINIVNSVVNPVIESVYSPPMDTVTSANPLQIWIPIYAGIWFLGMVSLFIYTGVSYWRLCRKVNTAVLYRDNIFQSEKVNTPFVLGVIKPRIYLPFGLAEPDLEHVVSHEQAHIRRKDHWWKPVGFLLLTVYWFNPLVWLAYVLLCRDIEIACDEKVIKKLDNEQRADYTQALVTCSVKRRTIVACPLAFGEVGVKERVKSVMNYNKPAFWTILISVGACAAVAVCFLTNPESDMKTIDSEVVNGETEQVATFLDETQNAVQAEAEGVSVTDDVLEIFSVVYDYYAACYKDDATYAVNDLALLEQSQTEALVEVEIMKDEVVRWKRHNVRLQLVDGIWEITEVVGNEMVFVMNRIFYITNRDVSAAVEEDIKTSVIDSPYVGTIQSVVAEVIDPTEELQANFDCEGAEVVFYSSGIAVNMNGKWIAFL